MMSAPSKCRSFWIVYWRKMCRRVWRSGSGTPFSRALMFCQTSVSRSSKNSWEKRGDPTVVPSKQKPSVNSTGIVFVLLMGFFLTENLAMVALISSASDGLTSAKRGMIDVLSVEVRMRVLCTFRIRRRGAASSRMVVHVNLRSTKGMVPHTSST